jgi:hypothetical protein
VLAHEHARRAGVVEVNVAEQQMAYVAQREPTLGKARFQRVDGRRRPAVEERGAVVRVEQVRADDAWRALVMEVDRLDARIL